MGNFSNIKYPIFQREVIASFMKAWLHRQTLVIIIFYVLNFRYKSDMGT